MNCTLHHSKGNHKREETEMRVGDGKWKNTLNNTQTLHYKSYNIGDMPNAEVVYEMYLVFCQNQDQHMKLVSAKIVMSGYLMWDVLVVEYANICEHIELSFCIINLKQNKSITRNRIHNNKLISIGNSRI